MDMRVQAKFLVPGLWRTLKKPISAPRCLGSRATSRSVSALARKQKIVDEPSCSAEQVVLTQQASVKTAATWTCSV